MDNFNWLPFISENVQETEIDCYSITGVVFTEDLGPWKKGQQVKWLSVDFANGLIIEHDESGKNVAFTQIKLQAINSEILD